MIKLTKLNKVKMNEESNKQILTNKMSSTFYVNYEDISSLEPTQEGTFIVMKNGQNFMVLESIDEIQNKKAQNILHG